MQITAQAGLHTLKSAQELLDAAEISYECEVAQGDPAHTLIDISERFACDLIVMGVYAQKHRGKYDLGPVAKGFFDHMTLPVLMAH